MGMVRPAGPAILIVLPPTPATVVTSIPSQTSNPNIWKKASLISKIASAVIPPGKNTMEVGVVINNLKGSGRLSKLGLIYYPDRESAVMR